jgi:hypothetical protein
MGDHFMPKHNFEEFKANIIYQYKCFVENVCYM